MMKFKFPLPFLVLLLLLFTTYSCNENTERKAKNTRDNSVGFIEGIVVKPSTLAQTIMVSGTLKPFEETVLMPDVTGRVVLINFQEGMFVKKGALLVQLFNDDLKAGLQKLQAQLEIAQLTQKRQGELMGISGISQQEYDQAVLQVNSINADIEIIKAQLSKTEIYAPFDGVIGLRNVSVGAVVTPNTALATIRQVNKLKLEFSFPGKYSEEIKKGSTIIFTLEDHDKKFEAEVMATEMGVDVDTRNLNALALVNSVDPSLVPGLYANVELRLKDTDSALMVPTQAIIPQERNKVVIVCKSGKAAFVSVKTGVRQSANIEVLSGIEPGDTIVTTGILFIKPNAVLKFAKVTN